MNIRSITVTSTAAAVSLFFAIYVALFIESLVAIMTFSGVSSILVSAGLSALLGFGLLYGSGRLNLRDKSENHSLMTSGLAPILLLTVAALISVYTG